MTIDYWTNFSKRKNSTKQPSSGTSLTVVLKEGTSIEKPVFLISGDHFDICYVKAFTNHYYFVDDIKSVRNGLTEVSCSMDPMATYKSAIGSYTCFIERAATGYDVMIADPLGMMKNEETILSIPTSGTGFFTYGGFYVLSVLNNIGSGAGFTCSYIMDITNIEALNVYVNNDWAAGASDFFNFIQASFLKTSESIIDCVWVPFAFAALDSSAYDSLADVKIGVDIVTGVKGNRLKKPCIASASITCNIPHYYADYRKAPPYTQCRMMIPGYGMVEINPLDFVDDEVHCSFDGDVSTGAVSCYLKDKNAKLIATYTYNVGVSCPVGKVGADVTGFATGAVGTAAGIAGAMLLPGAGAALSGIGATASAINTAASMFGPSSSVHGAKGGRSVINQGLDPVITSYIKNTVDPANLMTTEGLPVMALDTISNYSGGYIKCASASVPIAGMQEDRDTINNYLNTGFYYE